MNTHTHDRLRLIALIGLIPLFSLTSCYTPLVSAIRKNDMKKATDLIANGANLNEKSLSCTPLYFTVWYNKTDFARLLIKNGVDIDEKQVTRNLDLRPLNTAVAKGYTDMVKLLVDNGADINITNLENKSPLAVAEEKGYTNIVHILKSEPYVAKDSLKPTVSIAVNNVKEPFLSKTVRFIVPIPNYIPNTALSNNGYPSQLKKISSWGFGIGLEGRASKTLRIFTELTNYNYKQELAEVGETVHLVGTGISATFNSGAKYKTQTQALRLGIRYIYPWKESVQPWLGVAYGYNHWNVKYTNWDADKVYGEASGATWRSSILAGVDLNIKDFGTIQFFFDAISPVATFTMENLFELEDYHQFDAMTFPTPRIGVGFVF